MDSIDRRRLLTGAALGGAALVGATALGSVAPEAAFADEPMDIGITAPDPNFVEGRITNLNGSLLTVADAEGVINLVRITGATSIWKLHPTSLRALESGDGLYARGLRMPDGTLAADAVWANIVNLYAEVTWMGHNRLHLAHGADHYVGHIRPGLTSAVYSHGTATADLSKLRVGQHIQFIGAWRPDTDEYDIATIYA